ncbi:MULTISPECIES: FAD:protein FMN transferase [unclassified Mesorhizobium]|uniref:FAD:protein FMN transferase n=1 Tax=unclassified Mesorhizobium TaxID=325217 RepID=UPI001CCCD712|nr:MULTISPECIES: FAD:protein FMN transferase [unclassified Mesorhizobium]MCA0008702.1 FAD:protein FMN transferase [Mesorhizobium sp. B264B1B]MCA0019420.1 FAD:protein FMN transferase [Mesorhizobium sp. B264B1A]MCA0024539.1 FAD:protein FMN transferase [Mesorhizobium sp. B263B1A]MCA0055789.1 FAD:protein FMN transferase [Mesorhizobium sp. B261B1A]UCI16556.1 FAD:protein FMN transferase [Mesorhizobium sp. B2-1-1]
MGAQATLLINHPDRALALRLVDQVAAEVRRLERIFSLYREDSDLSRLNRQGFLVSPATDLVEILRRCNDVWRLTGRAFDPTVQPLWLAYQRHFSDPGATAAGPSRRVMQEALDRVGFDRLAYSEDRIELPMAGSALTLNGIAQGYATDKVVDLLRAGGVEHALVNMGEGRAIGSAPEDRPWRIGITDPFNSDSILKVLPLTDSAVATSSPAGFQFDEDGRFTHIIDPRTGSTPQRYASLSVVAPTATIADALSTAFSLMDVETIAGAVRRLDGVDAYVLSQDTLWTHVKS